MVEHDNTITSKRVMTRVTAITGGLLPVIWLIVHRAHVLGEHNGLIRAGLTVVMAFLIMSRFHREATAPVQPPSRRLIMLTAIPGALLASVGILVPVLQFQWIGLLLLAASCLMYGLPADYLPAIRWAFFMLYWAAPFPTRFFDALQTMMQRLSVSGTERLLHVFNVRVWAEGMVLHSATLTFEVPAWCSGMRTATTVFVLAIGLGILKRLGVIATLATVTSALFYALALNIMRIAAMVVLTQTGDTQDHVQFLHDTTAPIVLIAIALVVVQTVWLERRRTRLHMERQDTFPESLKVLSHHPPFWRRLFAYHRVVTMVLCTTLVAGVMAWRLRPAHRATMIRDVVQRLRDTGRHETAARAFAYLDTLQPTPGNVDWQLTGIRIDLARARYQNVLDALDALGPFPVQYQNQVTILRAYALMALGQLDEASGWIETLPARTRHEDPRIAMIRAELAFRVDDVDAVAANVETAIEWAPNWPRVQRLIPYLHTYRRWDTIAAISDSRTLDDPFQAFAVIEALMQRNQIDRVAARVRDAIRQWPTDPRVLEPLVFMAIRRPEGRWEERFANHLKRCLPEIHDPDTLYRLMQHGDGLVRPDLLWAVYRRLEAVNPDHPVLPMSIALFGSRWFRFRPHWIGKASIFAGDTVDLRPHFHVGNQLAMMRPLLATIPEGKRLAMDNTRTTREAALQDALTRFAQQQHDLSLPMRYLYSYALEMAGKIDAARVVLAGIATTYPGERTAVRVALSELYERAGDWVSVYEILRDYLLEAGPDKPLFQRPLLRLTEAQLQLRLGPAARFTARETLRRYPQSAQALELLARATMLYDSSEEALNRISPLRSQDRRETHMLERELLMVTERYHALGEVARRQRLPAPAIPPDAPQAYVLPPAEVVLLWHHTSIPADLTLAKVAEQIRTNMADTDSPGFLRIMQTWLAAWEHGCQDRLADPDYWAALGRDPLEKAMALHQLTVLLCREERFVEARTAAEQAVSYLPSDPVLQRALISLSGADPQRVQAAYMAVPDHSELWLAALVTAVRAAADQHTAAKAVGELIDDARVNHYAAGTLTRAADYLYRVGLMDEADTIIQMAEPRARGLLPVHIMSLRTALHKRDYGRALHSTRKAIDVALRPVPPLYEQLVHLRAEDGDLPIDSDMIYALQELRRAYPDHPLWAEMLGFIRFRRGGGEVIDALFQMQAAIEHGAHGHMAYVIAAKVYHLMGHLDRAEDVLRQGLERNPDNDVLLNNLAYLLSGQPERITEAEALIPRLEELAEERIPWLDTIAAIRVRAGHREAARSQLAYILQLSEPGSSDAFRARMHLAELSWREGRPTAATSILKEILQATRGIPDEDIREANQLLTTIQELTPQGATTRSP